MFGLIFLVSLFFLYYKNFLKFIKFLYLASKIPGPKNQIPLIGIIPQFIGKDLQGVFKVYKNLAKNWKENKLGKIWFGPKLFIVINSPENMQKILNAEECLDKPDFVKFFGIEQGSLFGTLEAWRRHRKILNPAFSLQTLRSFVPIFSQKSKKLEKSFEEFCDGSQFDVFSHLSAFFLETILNAAFDLDVDILNHKDKDEFVKHFDDYYSSITARMFKFWLHFYPFYRMSRYYKMEMNGRTKGSLKFVHEIFEKAKKNYRMPREKPNAIKSLMNPKHPLSDEEIKQEIITLLVAAQDSTTIVVSTTLLMLAMHKDIQQKVYEELQSVFTSDDPEITFETLNKLPYLEMVIKETMRLFPISAFTVRTLTEDFELDGFKIPAGANFFLSFFTLHRDKSFWGEDAKIFNPERFETDRIKDVHPYAYLPFSGGPRHCIGSKYAMLFMKTCLSRLLWKYEVDTTLKYDELKFRVSVTLKILQKIKISLNPRSIN